jgi:hypothetical protein
MGGSSLGFDIFRLSSLVSRRSLVEIGFAFPLIIDYLVEPPPADLSIYCLRSWNWLCFVFFCISQFVKVEGYAGVKKLCKSLLYMELSVLGSKSWKKRQKVQKSV